MKRILLLLLLLASIGCASYRVFDSDRRRPAWMRINNREQKGLYIAAEDYSNPKKSIKYFGRDLHSMGYIPIYLCIGNRQDYEFTVEAKDIVFKYENGVEAKSVKVEEVVEDAQSAPGVALLAFPLLIFPVVFIWDSIEEANFELDKDYTNKAFYDSYIEKDDELYGFIFFKIPEGQEDTTLQDARLELKVTKKANAAKKEMAEELEFIVSISQE